MLWYLFCGMELDGLAEARSSLHESVASAMQCLVPLPLGKRQWDHLLSRFLSRDIIVDLDVIKSMPIHCVNKVRSNEAMRIGIVTNGKVTATSP